MADNTWHIFPINDLKPHLEETTILEGKLFAGGEVRDQVVCSCECNPVIEYTENEGILVVHNSFDGREGLEIASRILGFKL